MNKEDAVRDFMETTYVSWTYSRFTDNEKRRFEDLIKWCTEVEKISGSWNQRWRQLQMIYHAFLLGLGYTGPGWRDSMAVMKKNGTWDNY